MTLSEIRMLADASKDEPIYDNPLFPPSRYYRFLKLLAARKKPLTSVVLGVCGGGDCLHLAIGWPYGYVVGVDITYDHPEQIGHIQSVVGNFQFWEGDSVGSAAKIHHLHGPVDILFIDTTHEEGQTLAEWDAWKPFLAPDAIVCFDDLFRPGMEEAWATLPGPKIRLDELHDGTYPNGGGFGVLIYTPEA